MDDLLPTDLLNAADAQQVVKELGVEGEDPEVQAEIIAQVGGNIMARTTLRVLEKLPEEDHGHFKQLIGSGDHTALKTLIDTHIPNFPELMQQESVAEIAKVKEKMAAILADEPEPQPT